MRYNKATLVLMISAAGLLSGCLASTKGLQVRPEASQLELCRPLEAFPTNPNRAEAASKQKDTSAAYSECATKHKYLVDWVNRVLQ